MRRKNRFLVLHDENRRKWKKITLLMRFDFVLFLLSFAAIAYFYGSSIVSIYGYSLSDLPVHNYWINALSDNELFVAGIYPEGAHCVEYYLHAVFGFDTYVILALFGFVQVACVIYGALFLMKLCCKNRFLPYIGFIVYVCTNIWSTSSYYRFYSTLPQEFGMIFIMPALYFGFDFFSLQYKELKAKKENPDAVKKSKTFIPLCGFCMSFAMTLMVHFYNTMILGVCCLVMAVAYFGLFIKKEYFKKIMATMGISVAIALLPMVIMFIAGTPLQGSLKWGMNVITSSTKTTSTAVNQVSTTSSDTYSDNTYAETYVGGSQTASASSNTAVYTEYVPPEKSLFEKIGEKVTDLNSQVESLVNSYIFNGNRDGYYGFILLIIAVLALEGLLYHFLGKRCAGSMLWTLAGCMAALIVMLSAKTLGLPKLMDSARACIYAAYFVPVILVAALDAALDLFSLMKTGFVSELMDLLAIALVAYALFFVIKSDFLRESYNPGFLESNEAVTCLTNIIRTQEDFTWTILSANDETQMGLDHGYHYEIITFLHELEGLHTKEPVYIPTEKIFVFIEKQPLNYSGGYYGKTVSEEYAAMELPASYLSSNAYKSEYRMICMSRMYYWMQEFIKLYPEDVETYFENDNFVCYCINQNTYRRFDLAIDYYYNTCAEAYYIDGTVLY